MTAPREFAVQTVRTLRDAGFEALWAGGCVRDLLLEIEPKDYDIATSARPKQIRDVFGHRRTLTIGAAFGVITLIGTRKQGQLEIATFREDAEYSDGRRPDAVSYSTAEADAQRRDFTINGIFYDPLTESIIDYVGGEEDLRRQVIRAIGDPRQRIAEDKLRMLRAIRFTAGLRFNLDSATLAAIQQMADEIEVVSGERIGAEFRRMLVDPSRGRAVRLLADSQLLGHVVGPLGDWFENASAADRNDYLEVLSRLTQPTSAAAFAAAMLPIRGPGLAETTGRKLRMTNHEIARAQWLLDHIDALDQADALPWSTLQPLLADDGGPELVTLREAVAGAGDVSASYCRQRLAVPRGELDPPPLLNGGDLIARGLKPGKQFREILTAVRAAQLDGLIASKEDALKWLDERS